MDESKPQYTDVRSGIKVGLGHPMATKLVELLRESDRRTDNLTEDLKRRGIKAFHPDDGWVNRENNSVHFCYPEFNLGPRVGDSIALGWEDGYRIVVVTAIEDKGPFRIPGTDNSRYFFRDTGIRYGRCR